MNIQNIKTAIRELNMLMLADHYAANIGADGEIDESLTGPLDLMAEPKEDANHLRRAYIEARLSGRDEATAKTHLSAWARYEAADLWDCDVRAIKRHLADLVAYMVCDKADGPDYGDRAQTYADIYGESADNYFAGDGLLS